MSKPEPTPKEKQARSRCGIVMPISEIDDCTETHWQDVFSIIKDALCDTSFDIDLVSSSNESGVIQARIVQSLFDDELVICDVSAKNPNVMFELGLRLAFDKPTVIIKDDKTDYSFDTSVIEHIPYPRDLHFHKIVEFKAKLLAKVNATHERAKSDADYSCFLRHFVKYKPKELPTEELPATEVILKELAAIRSDVNTLRQQGPVFPMPRFNKESELCVHGEKAGVKKLTEAILKEFGGGTIRTVQRGPDHFHVQTSQKIGEDIGKLEAAIAENNLKGECLRA